MTMSAPWYQLTTCCSLREQLKGEGLLPLSSISRRAWEDVLRENGVRAEWHVTDDVVDRASANPVSELWVPAWVVVVERAVRSSRLSGQHIREVVRLLADDAEACASLVVAEALRAGGARPLLVTLLTAHFAAKHGEKPHLGRLQVHAVYSQLFEHML